MGHRLAVRLGQLSRGQRLFTLTQSVALTRFRNMFKLLQIPDHKGFSFMCLRAGKAAALAREGFSLFQVMQAGEWRSSAVLAYADEDEIDKAAFLNVACDSGSSSDVDG